MIKDEERQVLELSYVHGHSQRAIAEELNVSQMSVSRIQRRALDKLRAYFAERGQTPDFFK
jgi:RNA polymerase sigma-B factor